MKRLCVFDLDGTLVDSVLDIAAAVNQSLTEIGKPTHEVKEFYRMVGDGMDTLCRRALADGTEAEVQTLIARYRERYLKNCCVLTKPYHGILTMLSRLAENGIQLAILSNKPQEQAERVVASLLGEERFFAVVGQSERFPQKPDPTALCYVMREAKVEVAEVCYVGDSDVDIMLGKCVGVQTVGVAWGFRGSEELSSAGADVIVNSAEELTELLLTES